MSHKFREKITDLLKEADVKIDGSRPHDIKVHNKNLYKRILAEGSLGFGEAYIDGWWDCDDISEMVSKILKTNIVDRLKTLGIAMAVLKAKLLNMQSKSKAFEIGEKHYDIGNDLYKAMLDKRMVYTCGYWKDAKDLDQAQENKLDLTCRKIGLKEGMRILDIGCGWGSFAKFAAEKYKVEVVGVTVSREQVELGNKLCQGLPVEIRLQDYRDIKGEFDRIVSLGMFEHVGYKNYKTFMRVAHDCLKDQGILLLHTIGGNTSVTTTDPWIEKYIFPNSMLPSPKQIAEAAEGFFVMEDWHNFGPDYDKTLIAWHKNFTKNWNKLKDSYDQKFYRMWEFYLLSCAGSFRSRKNQLWQIVFSKGGIPGGYTSIR